MNVRPGCGVPGLVPPAQIARTKPHYAAGRLLALCVACQLASGHADPRLARPAWLVGRPASTPLQGGLMYRCLYHCATSHLQ